MPDSSIAKVSTAHCISGDSWMQHSLGQFRTTRQQNRYQYRTSLSRQELDAAQPSIMRPFSAHRTRAQHTRPQYPPYASSVPTMSELSTGRGIERMDGMEHHTLA
eukprot:3445076-Rhodomonas_salina.2